MGKYRRTIINVLKYMGWALSLLFLTLLIVPLPKNTYSFSTVLNASDGSLLGAKIADDGQWRFPIPDRIPYSLEVCMLQFEDQYFYYHPGINPVAITRAIRQNIKEGRVVSGGSTITMQLARILRGNRSRTFIQKVMEAFLSLQLELKLSKSEILKRYAGLAPFGGNVVGVDAAAWRYFGRSTDLLSWAESATLAVLPNAPSLIFPGRNQAALKSKRDRLLNKLYVSGILSKTDLELAKEEPLPSKPYPLPSYAPHLLDFAMISGHKGHRVESTIDHNLQISHAQIAGRYHDKYHGSEVHNMAILVADVRSGEIKSYIGNSNCRNKEEGIHVDIIQAARSSGSVLKPLLFAAALDEGLITKNSLLADVPVRFAGFAPKNFDKTYAGAVPSADALTRSLNIPAVGLLQEFGLNKFHKLLKEHNFHTINRGPDHYGLSLILGGAEITLFDLVNAYRSVARRLTYTAKDDQIDAHDNDPIHFIRQQTIEPNWTQDQSNSQGALWEMMDILANVKRPREETGWDQYNNRQKIAWKTGTSFGHRDAWAIGMNADNVVGVWIGNADGEGRPGLTGLNYAGPVLFEVFESMGPQKWFPTPYDELENVTLCRHSGFRIGQNCTDTIGIIAARSAISVPVCHYHKVVNIDPTESYQVDQSCYALDQMVQRSYFQLPTRQAYFYQKHNPNYQPLPPWMDGCQGASQGQMEVIYPFANTDVSIPRNLDGDLSEVILSIAHANPKATVHWHIDERYIETTKSRHSIAVRPSLGEHLLTAYDQSGNEVRRKFKIVE